MVIQLEDVVDCLKLYPQYDYVFLFDNRYGNSKKRTGGLDATSMNRLFGGTQPRMRKTFIKAREVVMPRSHFHWMDIFCSVPEVM